MGRVREGREGERKERNEKGIHLGLDPVPLLFWRIYAHVSPYIMGDPELHYDRLSAFPIRSQMIMVNFYIIQNVQKYLTYYLTTTYRRRINNYLL